jgi:hypothetical protein
VFKAAEGVLIMSKTVSVGYTDTAISGVTSLNLARGLVNYGADWRVKQDEPTEVILTNLTSPINYPERVRVGATEVADVYKGSGVEPGLYAPTRRGISILSQLTEVWKVSDTVDSAYEVALPITGHIVLKVPNSDQITPEMINTFLGRLVSTLFETGSDTTSRIASILRGSLTPSDI